MPLRLLACLPLFLLVACADAPLPPPCTVCPQVSGLYEELTGDCQPAAQHVTHEIRQHEGTLMVEFGADKRCANGVLREQNHLSINPLACSGSSDATWTLEGRIEASTSIHLKGTSCRQKCAGEGRCDDSECEDFCWRWAGPLTGDP